MGEFYCSINVRSSDADGVAALLPDFAPQSILPGWVTAAVPQFDAPDAQKAAKRLSKALPQPVLTTFYFDDDFVDFTLFFGGKTVARHAVSTLDEFPAQEGKSKAWAKQLGLSADDEKTLKLIFKEPSPEVCIRLMECLLRCPLCVFPDGEADYVPTEVSFLTDYAAAKTAKLKNLTKLRLLDEIDCFAPSRQLPYLFTSDTSIGGSGKLRKLSGGSMHELCELHLPGHYEECIYGSTPYGGICAAVFSEYRDPSDSEYTLYIIDEHGDCLDRLALGEFAPSCLTVIDDSRVMVDIACRNFRTHETEWRLDSDLNCGHQTHSYRLSDGRVFVNDYCLDGSVHWYCLDADGGDLCVLDGDDERVGSLLTIDGSEIYSYRDGVVRCLDSRLELLWEAEIGDPSENALCGVIDPDTKMLYFLSFSGCYRLKAFRIPERKVTATRLFGQNSDFRLQSFLPGVGPICGTGIGSAEVLNASLETVSRHKLKGIFGLDAPGCFMPSDGKTYLLSPLPLPSDEDIPFTEICAHASPERVYVYEFSK